MADLDARQALQAVNRATRGEGLSACCSMQDVLRWSGCQALGSAGDEKNLLPVRRVRAGAVLVHEHQPLDAFYMVSAGCLKLSSMDADGFEQVVGFALRGDVLGLDACNTGYHTASAVALDDASVTPLARWATLHEQQALPGSTLQLLQHAAARELQHRTEAQYVMAPASAEVRVARFLIQFGRRQQALGYSSSRFRLPMGRRDIACFLGLAHETVSRSLTLLVQAGYLQVEQREVVIVDAQRFATMARATRGPSAVSRFKRRGAAATGAPLPMAA